MNQVKVSGCTLNFQSIGRGRPVVFLHGFTADHRLMKGAFEPILRKKRGVRRIYVDLPGMGRSRNVGVGNADDMLNALLEFIEKTLPREKVSLVGESYGGYLAQGIFEKLPERVEGMLLLCPVVHPHPKDRALPQFQVRRRDDAFLKRVRSSTKADFESMTATQTQATWKAFQKDILPGIELHDRAFCEKYFQTGYGFRRPPVCPKVDVPLLVLTGRQDPVVGFEDAFAHFKASKLATFAVLDGAGHNLQIECSKLFSALVQDWLERVDLSGGV